MKYTRRALQILLASILLSSPVWAEDQGDGTLHVLRPLVHVEQDEGELCLEFDHDIDTNDHRHVVTNLHLESAGKNLNIASRNVSLDGNLLCVSGLDHRREYRFAIGGMKGAKGEKMAGSYSLAFTIPDRQASLAFTSDTNTGFMRWQDNKDPMLRSMNVAQVTLELYRITDPEMMVAAWQQRRQALLAPSESATFAHDHGQLVWSGTLDLADDANKNLEQKVPLHDSVADVAPGLYLIVARGPDEKTKEDKSKTATLAPTSALWLLRSNLKIHALQDKDGFYALAEKTDGSEVIRDTRFVIEDAKGEKLTEGKAAEEGTLLLTLPGDKKAIATTLAGYASSGDVDFNDLTQAGHLATPTGGDANIKTDKSFYLPASPVIGVLTGHDQAGHALNDSNASLQVTWADGSPYTSLPAVPDKSGIARISFTSPATNGEWVMIWHGGDGRILAQEKLHVTSNADAPQLQMSADKPLLPSGGDIDLMLKSQTIDGKPFPYLSGRLAVAWSSPDRVFQEWHDYHFGTTGHPAGDSMPLSSFLTDEKGTATLHMSLVPPDDGALLHTAILQAHSENAQGASDPAPLTLPVKPKNDIIGVRPLAVDGRFPENSLARFSVIALDPDGHRKNIDDLAYQIFEEGRSFDWHPEEGRWGYKQLQQNRRLGGGTLTIDENRESIIEWPVAAGNYRLEITDSNGTLRTSFGFSAGWGGGETKPNLSPLELKPSVSILRPGQKTEIKFNLGSPSMIGAFIGDDHIRKIIHQPMDKGDNTIGFVPDKDWGGPVNIRIEAYNAGLIGQTNLLFHQEEQKPVEPIVSENKPASDFTADLQIPDALHIGDNIHAVLNLKNDGKTPIAYHFVTPAGGGIKISDIKDSVVTLTAGQDKKLPFTVTALRAGTATLRLDVLPPHANESHEWPLSIVSDNMKSILGPSQKIEPNQSWPIPTDKQHTNSPGGILFLSSTPIFNAPLLLVDLLKLQPFTTPEIADVSRVLRVWQDPLIDSGLQTKKALDARREALVARLMTRQKSDGGFPILPGDASDFDSTAQALRALAHADSPAAKPAMELAATWLRHRLENTWFEEKERPLRPVAYLALAEADRLDVSSLHYFSDTSADKSLPSLAAAQLALAFAYTGDQAKAGFWLDASGIHKSQAEISVSLLPVLAANSFFDVYEAAALMEKSADKMKDVSGIETSADFLLTAWSIQHRMNAWRVTINTDKKNPKDILAIPPSEKTAPSVVHNTNDAALFLSELTQTPISSPAHPIARRIYQLNGVETETHALERGQTYLVVLEGPWPGRNSGPVEIHDDVFPAMRPVACLTSEFASDNNLAWLKSQNFNPQISCEIAGGAIDVLDKKEGDGWRVAYLAKVEGIGSFFLPPANARNIEGNPDPVEGIKTRVDIK